MGLPSRISDIPGDLPDDEALIALMAQDKKVQDGKLRFILAHGIGRAFVTDAVAPWAAHIAQRASTDDQEEAHCSACNGTGEGQFDGQSCSVCRGRGY